MVSSCGDHQPSSSALGARGSPDPPGPMGIIGLGENQASAAILSQDALGLRFDPEQSFHLQNAAPRSAFGAVSEIGPRLCPT